jgi:multidrug transporter EmrE-like cation transporter
MNYLFLALAIASEVLGSTSLKLSQGFTRLLPSVFVVLGFGTAFFFLSQALRTIPLSVAYAVWAGVGTAATVLIGVWLFRESFDLMKFFGIVAILVGVVLLNLKGAH